MFRSLLFTACAGLQLVLHAQPVTVDLSAYSPAGGIDVHRDADKLHVVWPMAEGEFGRAVFNLHPGAPLIDAFGISTTATAAHQVVLRELDPATFLTVGTRSSPPGRPPEMSVFNVFFDYPTDRPHHTHQAALKLSRVRVASTGRRVSVAFGDVTADGFRGEIVFTFYASARLIHQETVVSTDEDRRAILYDTGLASATAGWTQFGWMDLEGRPQSTKFDAGSMDRALHVRHRTLVAESANGSLACFPPPHQFQFPRDSPDNLAFAWLGKDHAGFTNAFGFGVRQHPTGSNKYIPWFNAPPGTKQRLGVFYLLSRGKADDALRETLRFTHGDRFVPLPGHLTLSSHYHMAVGVSAMQQREKGVSPLPVPEFVGLFTNMGVQAVHLGDFHGDGHQKDPGPLRLPEMQSMFDECRRLSGRDFLLIPGEEVSGIYGVTKPNQHPGHWMSVFPKPVYWTQVRQPGQPFAEPHPQYGTVYHVGSAADMFELLKREGGLGWSAHPRIKASNWAPDAFRNEDYYLADQWLGGAWKAMPADLSRERLGERVLNLLDDMANWGQRKYTPGEVDVFKLTHYHELYGHMNVNYLRLARLPRYEEGWQPVLDALRGGKFFVTTGEVLVKEFTVDGKRSGETLKSTASRELRADLEWTFPLKFAEVISGDGANVYRERIDLADTIAFGNRTLTLRPELRGRKWVRFEVWDVAANGAFTMPVWLE